MDAQDLLAALREDARRIARSQPAQMERLRAAEGNGEGPAAAVAAYDYQAFTGLLGRANVVPGVVDEAALAGFRSHIDCYMDTYAPGDEGFKEYVRTVSVYLAFVARMPLHPPGMRFSGGRAIVLSDGAWRCPGKREHARDPLSLCRYCVCQAD